MSDRQIVGRITGSISANYEAQQQAVAQEQRMLQLRQQARQAAVGRETSDSPLTKIGEILSSAGELVSDWWTDDFSSVPVAGPAASAVAERYTDATEGINRILTTPLLAANPRYWENRDNSDSAGLWQDANNISVGQAGLGALDASGLGSPADIYDSDPTRNIVDPAQRGVYDEGWGRVASGLVDAGVTWFLDPFVLAGKGVKVARFGTRFMGSEIVGLSARKIEGPKVIDQIGREADQALSGNRNILRYEAERVAAGDFAELRTRNIFQGANRDILAGVAHHITDVDDAVVFLAAAAGSTRHQRILRETQANTYLTLQRRTGMENPYETRILNQPVGEAGSDLLPDLLEKGVKAEKVIEDLAKRDPEFAAVIDRNRALRNAEALIDENPAGLLENAGSRSVTARQIADAWRDGKQARKTALGNKGALTTRQTRGLGPRDGTGPAAFERVYQLSSMAPRVRVWEWLGGYHASGYINVRGFNEGKASDELAAALSDSKIIRRDGAFVREQMNIYGAAIGPQGRVAAIARIEENVWMRHMEHYGVKDLDGAKQIYSTLDKRRWDTVSQFMSRGYAVDEAGEIIKMGPRMRSQLETSMPMLDFRVMDKSARIAAKSFYNMTRAEKVALTGNVVKNMADEIQSLWKAAVLLRLGYTVRNTVEGWLRTAAVLGSLPSFKQPIRSVSNSWYNNRRRVQNRTPGMSARSLAKQEDKTITELQRLRTQLEEVRAGRSAQLQTNPLANAPRLDRSAAQLEEEIAATETILARIQSKLENVQSRRYYDNGAFAGTYSTKVDGKRQEFDLEFLNGELVRRLSSAQKTNETVLYSEWMRGAAARLNDNAYAKVDPGKPQYWQELAQSIRQFRNDDVAKMILDGKSDAEILAWSASAASRGYRRDMRIPHQAMEGKIVELRSMVNRYLPTDEVRIAAAGRELTPGELRTMLGGLRADAKPKKPTRGADDTDEAYEAAKAQWDQELAAWEDAVKLSPIHGREVERVTSAGSAASLYHTPIEKLFALLGNYPESALVRHPFYAEVWKRRMDRMVEMAQAQGTKIDSELLIKLNSNAHRYAMRATNETLYTIERYSNIAHVMRWVAPFFPAWENSARVWAKIVVNDPSVAVRASILWQMPNQLGMVVDAEGNPVKDDGPLSFLTGSQDRFIVLPEEMVGAIERFADKFGDVPVVGNIAKGAAAFGLKVPQGSFNVVTPGQTPYLPGLGPLAVVPVGKFLSTKPDLQADLRKLLPSGIYQQFVPFGAPEDDVLQAFMPPWARRWYQDWQGENNDQFLGVAAAMMQTAMVDWYRSGGDPANKPDMDAILEKTHDFYKFAAFAAITLPVSVTRMSPYQLQLDEWNRLKADETMTYPEKIDAFLTQFGDDFLPLTVSSTEGTVPGLDPTIDDYAILRDNADLVRELTVLDPTGEAVGLLASSAPVGVFDAGVYDWLQREEIPGLDLTYRSRRDPGEMQTAIVMQKAWRDYRKAKALRDQELAARGVSIQSNDAEDIKQAWDGFKAQMAQEYGEPWVAEFGEYENRSPVYLAGIQRVLGSGRMDSNPMWGQVREYMETRQNALDAIAAGYDSADVRDWFAQWSEEYRWSSLEFSDFYDKFLEQDQELREYNLEALSG
jgi:hypothetical protein